MRRLVIAPLVSLILASPGFGICGEGDGLQLAISGPAVPYAKVVYEIRERRETVTVRITKRFAGAFGRREAVGLLPLGELGALLRSVDTKTLARRAPPGPVRYELTLTRTGKTHRGWLALSPGAAEPPLAARLRGVVERACDPLPFQDDLLLPGEAGRLRLRTDRPAALAIDGVPLPGQTPFAALRLTAGAHRLTLTPLDGGEARVYPIKVMPGKTTTLSVELR